MNSSANAPSNNLRAVVILIVVAFRSALPYLASQPPQRPAFDVEPYRWIAFPIINRERWFGFDLFCVWQDSSLMLLMFFSPACSRQQHSQMRSPRRRCECFNQPPDMMKDEERR
jgi:hypothetical protein